MQTNEYGLVPGVALKTFEVYRKGTLCGFEPAIAQKLQRAGYWRPSSASAAAAADESIREKEVEEDGNDALFLVAVETGTLQIPHNWREQHHTKKKAWATQIKGEAVSTVPAADEIIAAAVKDQEDALTPAG